MKFNVLNSIQINQAVHCKGAVNIWFTILSCTMVKKDKHGTHSHIYRIPKIVIASINTHKWVAQVSNFNIVNWASPWGKI